jgi:hypothetical protein
MITSVGIVEDVQGAAEWVAVALTRSGYRADFSPRSVREMERFFDTEAPGGRARPDGLLADDRAARLFALGSYLGEVLRRNVGGSWQGDDADPDAEVNVALDLPDGSRVWPVQRVMKRLANGPQDSLIAYGAVLGLDIGSEPKGRRRKWFRL